MSVVSSIACAASRSTILVRRSSPCFSASALDLVATSLRSFALLASSASISSRSSRQRLLLLADLHLFEPGEVAQARIEDFLGLLVRELEALHQHRLRLILAADDADHLIEVQESDQQSVEDVQASFDLVQAVLSRRVTVRVRNSSQPPSTSFRPITRGRPSRPMMLRLTR